MYLIHKKKERNFIDVWSGSATHACNGVDRRVGLCDHMLCEGVDGVDRRGGLCDHMLVTEWIGCDGVDWLSCAITRLQRTTLSGGLCNHTLVMEWISWVVRPHVCEGGDHEGCVTLGL